MVKIIALLLSAAAGAGFGYLFYTTNQNVLVTVLMSIVFFITAIIAQVLLFFIIVMGTGLFENKKKERRYQSKFWHNALYALEKFGFSFFSMKRHYTGREYLCPGETYIMVGNHRSNLDTMLVDVYLKSHKIVFIAKDSLFKNPCISSYVHGSAYIKLYRGEADKEFSAYNIAEEMLTRYDNPHSVAIFPEGTRNLSWDNTDVQEFKPGVFRLAKKTQRPIAIFALRGTKEVNKHLLTKVHNVYLDIIEVLEYETYKDWDVNQIATYTHDKIQTFLKENCK